MVEYGGHHNLPHAVHPLLQPFCSMFATSAMVRRWYMGYGYATIIKGIPQLMCYWGSNPSLVEDDDNHPLA
jgi:hypothetical protein